MRIAVSGAHGVGKTTLAEALAVTLNLPRIDEVARTVAAEFDFQTSDQIFAADKETVRRFQRRIFFRQLMAEDELQSFVSDRSIFDPLSYMYVYALPELAREYYSLAVKQARKYDIIIYCPIPYQNEVADDGFRLTDPQSQQDIDFILGRMLAESAKGNTLRLPRNRDLWLTTVESKIRKAAS